MKNQRSDLLNIVKGCFDKFLKSHDFHEESESITILIYKGNLYLVNGICFGTLSNVEDVISYKSCLDIDFTIPKDMFKLFQCIVPRANCSEEFKNKFLDWLTYESPYQEAFIKDDMEFMRANNFLELDVSKDHRLVAGAAMNVRFPTELCTMYRKSGECMFMEKLVSLGCPMISSYILANFFGFDIKHEVSEKISNINACYCPDTSPVPKGLTGLINLYNNSPVEGIFDSFEEFGGYNTPSTYWHNYVYDYTYYDKFFNFNIGKKVKMESIFAWDDDYDDECYGYIMTDEELKEFHDRFCSEILGVGV